MSIGPVNPPMSSFLSVSSKRDALWNVVEPGDPYDIRKSMIAKVPGDKKNFMGDYLEIVCLFQAAEIERLCEFLDDFKLKYRQIERRQLDRHSYEIQIKQLNHKLAEQSEIRQENQKLREFIKNLSSNRQEVQDNIKFKYERLLIQFKGYEDQNARLKRQNEQLQFQISSFDAKFQALRKSKQSQIEDLYSKLSQQSSASSQFELNSLRSQYESQIQRIDLQNRRIKQINDDNLRQIESWQQKYRILEKELFNLPSGTESVKYERQIAQYENRFVIFGQQIDRLNLVVKEITNKFQISEQRNRDYENKLQGLNRQLSLIQDRPSSRTPQQSQQLLKRISELEGENRRLQESGRYSEESEMKLRFSNEEIMRLTNQVRLEAQNANRLKNELLKFQYEGSKVNILEKELYEAKQLAGENNSLKIKIAEDQNKVAILRQEIERLKEELFKKGGLDSNYQSLVAEYQRLQRTAQELDRRNQLIAQEYEARITQKVAEYESRIQFLNRTKGSEFQSTTSLLQGELQRLGDILKRRNQEMEAAQRQLRQLNSAAMQNEMQVSRRMQNYESVIQGLKRQNQEVIRRVRELQTFQRKTSELQTKNTIISQQVQRLNQQLRNKDIDIENLKIKLRDQQIAIVQKYQMDTTRKIGTYQMGMNNLARQNEQFKRRYTEMETKSALLGQEIERLTNKMREIQTINSQYEQQIQRLQRLARQTEINLTNKYGSQLNQRISNYESVIRNLQIENEEMRKGLIELENSNRKIVEYEKTLQQLARQLERVSGALRQKQEESLQLQSNNKNLARQLEEIMRKHSDLQNTVRTKYEVETSRTISGLEQNIAALSRENNELKRYIQDYENRLRSQGQDLQSFNMNVRNLSQQNQALKRQIQEIQSAFKSKLDVEVSGKYRSYQSTIQNLKRDLENFVRQNNELKRVLQVAQQNNVRLNQDNETLRKHFNQQFQGLGSKLGEYEGRIGQLQNENQGLKRIKTQMQSAIRQYEADATRKISSLDQNFVSASRQNDDLRRRLEQVSRQFQQSRRMNQKFERDNEQLARKLREFGDVNRKVAEFQSQLSMLAQEHERTLNVLKVKTDELGQAELFIKQLSNKLQNTERTMAQSHSSIQQFQSDVKTRIAQYEQSITLLGQQNINLKNALNELNARIAEYESKIVILNQQLQRINSNLRGQVQKSNHYENALRQSGSQNQQLVKKLNEMQNTITQRYEVEATRNIRALEQNIEALQKENNQLKGILQEYEQKLNVVNIELQKINSHLTAATEENNNLKNQLKETELYFTRKYQTEVTAKYAAYQRDLANYQKQIDDLVKKLTEYAERVVPQYEKQATILRQEIEKINQHFTQQKSQSVSNLNALSQQNEGLNRKLVELQQTITQKYEVELNQKISFFQQNINALKKQNQDLKRYIQQFGGHYEGLGQNFTILQKENESLKKNLQEINQKFDFQVGKVRVFEQNTSALGRQNEQLKRKLVEMQQQLQRLIRKMNEMSQENETIRRQARQNEMQMAQRFQAETAQQTALYKQQISQIDSHSKSLQRQVQDLQRRLNEVGGDASRTIATLQDELKRCMIQVEKRSRAIQQYDSKVREFAGQNDALKRQVRETEISITQRWETEFKSKINAYEQAILSINQTVQQREKEIFQANNKRIMQLQNKAAIISQQLERVNHILRAKSEQNQKMRQQIERLNNTLRLKLQETRQLETEYEKLRSVTQSEFFQLQTAYNMIVKDNQNYKNNLLQYENSIQKLYAEFQRLQKIIHDFKNERQSLCEKNFGLSNQIQRLNAEIKKLEAEVEQVRLRLSDESALQKRINEHMALFVVLFAEIESLRKRMKDKEKQMQEVRRSSIAPFKLESRARGESS